MLKSVLITLSTSILLQSCAQQQSRPSPSIDLRAYHASGDVAGLTVLCQTQNRSVRNALESLLAEFLHAKAAGTPVDSLLPRLQWLTDNYQSFTGLRDKSKKLSLYDSWTVHEASDRLTLDSLQRVANEAYRKSEIDDTAYLGKLRHLQRQYQEIRDSFGVALADYRMAAAYEKSLTIDSAEFCLARAIAISRLLDFPELAGESELRLYEIYSVYRADYGRADSALRSAEVFYEQAGMTDRIVSILINRAKRLADLYKSAEAIDGYREAIAAAQRFGAARSARYCLSQLGETYYDLNEFDSALAYARQSLSISESLVSSRPELMEDVGYDLTLLGLIEQAGGNREAASQWYEKADAIAQAPGLEALLATNRIRWASLCIEQKDYSRARELCASVAGRSKRVEDELFSQYGVAIADYMLANMADAKKELRGCIARFENSRRSLPDPAAKTGMLSDKIGMYNLLIVIYLEEYQRDSSRLALDSAFHYLEKSKAQSLLEMLAARDGDPAGTPNTERNNAGTTPVTLEQTQRDLLSQTDVLLEYILTEEGSYALLITSDDISVRHIPSDKVQIDDLVGRYVASIDHYPSAADSLSRWRVLGDSLYRTIIPSDDLTRLRKEHLIILPAGRLHYLPFEALINPAGRFLIEDYEISYVPSLTVLADLPLSDSTAGSVGGVVEFGDPIIADSTIAQLPFSKRELDSLNTIFGTDKVRRFDGPDATAGNFKSYPAAGVQVIHIATHGITDPDRPGNSALIFSPEAGEFVNSRLESGEIARLDLPVDLAFLSACYSGGGGSYPGEGVLSLVQPFLVAGCRSVIVSDWGVFDRYAAELSPRFYRYYHQGYSKCQSLASAKRDLLKSKHGLAAHPYFWAPFVLVGQAD